MTKDELRHNIALDLARFGGKKPRLKDRILHNEMWYIWNYIEHMRFIEFHESINSGNPFVKSYHKIAAVYHWYKLKHLQFKLHLAIYPNTLGPGFRIYHIGGYTHIGPNVRIGKNCTMVSGVVFGNKTEEEDDRPVIVGDNVYFGIHSRVLGPVKIGNNVTIAANAVVTKDIPDNAVVGGIPAKIIKFKDIE